MRLNDSDAWSKFVYVLLYPGILGSMLYEATNTIIETARENRMNALEWYLTARFLVIILYCLDFLHMYNDLDKKTKASKWWLFVDTVIPIIFAVAYWLTSREAYTWQFGVLSVAFILIWAYPSPQNTRRFLYKSGKSLALAVALLAFVAFAIDLYAYYFYWSLALTITYALHVFLFTTLATELSREHEQCS